MQHGVEINLIPCFDEASPHSDWMSLCSLCPLWWFFRARRVLRGQLLRSSIQASKRAAAAAPAGRIPADRGEDGMNGIDGIPFAAADAVNLVFW